MNNIPDEKIKKLLGELKNAEKYNEDLKNGDRDESSKAYWIGRLEGIRLAFIILGLE